MIFSLEQIRKLFAKQWFLCGIEKEGLRVSALGHLSNTLHPEALGSKLTHPFVTTDFAEAQLELITSPWPSTHQALAHLQEVHSFVLSQLADEEYLWPASMPCILPTDDQINIASFGSSFMGQAKTIYRRGLGYRYGRSMQAVSGLHFNFSITEPFWKQLAHNMHVSCNQDFINERYFDLIRNYRRYSFVINWLFGASSCFDQSFLDNSRQTKHDNYTYSKNRTWLASMSTSLRMSDIGYMAAPQAQIRLCCHCLQDYTDSLRKALRVVIPEFKTIKVRDEQGLYRQLNSYLLQIENEYYSQIRPKRNTNGYLRPVHALEQQGIEYIEIRNIDLDPEATYGITQSRADFMILFLLWCLLNPSPVISDEECKEIQSNLNTVNRYGRGLDTQLIINGALKTVNQAVEAVFDKLRKFAQLMDQAGIGQYLEVLEELMNNELPSQIIEEKVYSEQQGFSQYMLSLARAHKRSTPQPSQQVVHKYTDLAEKSHKEQSRVEQENHESGQTFEQFIENYMRL